MARETLIIGIRADGARQVERSVRGIGTQARKSEAGVRLLRRALLFVGVVETMRRIIGTMATFGQAMATVRAISNATQLEFEALRQTAIRLGATTRFSATEAAEGLLFLSRAGFTARESLQTIEGVLKLAQAGSLGLGRAADIASNVLRGFKLEASETARVVDVLALAANSSNTTVEQLGDALKFVAPIAQGVGLTLEQTTAAIAELSNAGLQASLAGTGLRRVIGELESPSSNTRKEIALLGLQIDRGEISTIGLLASLQRLTAAGVDTGQALEIFGQRGGPAFAVLSGGTEKVAELEEQLNNAAGSVDRIAALMDDTLQGALFRVRSATETVILAFGDLGGESLVRSGLEALAKTLRGLAKDSAALEGVLAMMAFLILPAVLKAVRAITAALLKNPFALIAITIAVVIGQLVKFRDQIFLSTDGMISLGDFAGALFELLVGGFVLIREVAAQALDNIATTFGFIFGEDLPGGFEGFLLGMAKGVDFIIGIFSGLGAVIINTFKNPLGVIGFLTIELFNVVARGVNAINRFLSRQIRALVDQIKKLLAIIPGVSQKIRDDFAKIDISLGQTKELEQKFLADGIAAGDAFRSGVEKSTQATDLTKGLIGRSRELGVERRQGPTQEELDRQKELDDLLNGRGAALKTIGTETDKNTKKTTDGQAALEGFNKAFKEVRISAEDFGKAIGTILIGAIDQLSNAIADAVVDGLQDFESFKENLSNIFRDIAKQIIALIIKFLILKALEIGLGLGAPTTPPAKNPNAGVPPLLLRPGLAAGGPIGAGEGRIVGERGPELFVPEASGRIQPNSSLGGDGGTSITIIQVKDREEMLSAMSSTSGKKIILGTLNENPGALAKANR